MGVDLVNKDQYIHFNWHAWASMLRLAADNGWEPMGTTMTPEMAFFPYERDEKYDDPQKRLEAIKRKEEFTRDWDGNYMSNNYQTVTKEDAKNLADTLENVLNETNHDLLFGKEECPPELRAKFDVMRRESIRLLIDFCREGEFTLE